MDNLGAANTGFGDHEMSLWDNGILHGGSGGYQVRIETFPQYHAKYDILDAIWSDVTGCPPLY